MKYKFLILIVILVLFLPLVINYLVTRNKLWDYLIAGEPKDWMFFWISYLSSLASFAMVYLTWHTLKQMEKQWESEKNPHIVLSIGIAQKCFFLKIYNTGILPAYNVRLSINQDFINNLSEDAARDCINNMMGPFFVDGRTAKYVYIGSGDSLTDSLNGKSIDVTINGTYCDNKSIDTFTCNVRELVGKKFARITDELTHAVEGLEKSISSTNSDTNYMTIQKSLDSIAKTLKLIKNIKYHE